eukprot:CAMPEP_0197702756 /NCGR_PEP_ID=MMETSP1338-20131121/124907_1 /TAXON_ID=43686 ORGANISM="Pelagodinium beii, Strain RCC1491" /NCGR_SAMPLE_ID=MMETSP1338 /ASSEMBLY_ACC=CAM_ASM_000754 /LENGTH=170 /DNA_ID=CAMNT_0043286621 /DNA_START=31 /DNA_END=539 /DNA_ORIENTATION=+
MTRLLLSVPQSFVMGLRYSLNFSRSFWSPAGGAITRTFKPVSSCRRLSTLSRYASVAGVMMFVSSSTKSLLGRAANEAFGNARAAATMLQNRSARGRRSIKLLVLVSSRQGSVHLTEVCWPLISAQVTASEPANTGEGLWKTTMAPMHSAKAALLCTIQRREKCKGRTGV